MSQPHARICSARNPTSAPLVSKVPSTAIVGMATLSLAQLPRHAAPSVHGRCVSVRAHGATTLVVNDPLDALQGRKATMEIFKTLPRQGQVRHQGLGGFLN